MSQTDKQLAGNQRRSLRKIREQLLRMAAEWDGVDGYNETQLTELADQVERVSAEMIEDEAIAP